MNSLQRFILNFTNEEIGEIIFLKNTYYFKTSNTEIKKELYSPGLPLGVQGKQFKPSLYLLELLSKKTSNKIFVKDKAEWLFLCGRDIFLENVKKDTSTSNVFLVQNLRDENLGLGKKIKKRGKTIIKNLLDRGDFLRRER